jgi:pimeloyl-ACP methyl ester carboxylesterase
MTENSTSSTSSTWTGMVPVGWGRSRGQRCGPSALVVAWSYGAFVGAHWASRNPERALGAVLVDGAQPYDWLDEAMEQRIRKLFRRMGWFMPLLRPTGLTPRMTAQHAQRARPAGRSAHPPSDRRRRGQQGWGVGE